MTERSAKTQISLGIRPVWSVFAVHTKEAWALSYPVSASDDSVQAGRVPRLIWVFAGRKLISLVLSWGRSYLSYDIASESVMKPCIKNDSPLVD